MIDKQQLIEDIFGTIVNGKFILRDIIAENMNIYINNLDSALATLLDRERTVIEKRYSGMTYREIIKNKIPKENSNGYYRQKDSLEFISSSEGIRQLLRRTRRKLRQVPRSLIIKGEIKTIKEYVDKGRTIYKEHKEQNKKEETLLIDELNLSCRAYKCLKKTNIKFVKELTTITERELYITKNVGRKTVREIKEILAEMGLSLKEGKGI